MNTQITSTDLQQKIQGYLETLALETDQARKSEEMQRYLDFVSRFHQYSPSNIFLIMLTKPDATHVAGFQAWKKMGRYVKKGEHGIPIFAPMIHKEDPDRDDSPKLLLGFRVVYVFDVSQTDGDPLPPVPDWKSPEKNAELNEKLIQFAQTKGISISIEQLDGEVQGISMGGKIKLSPVAGTKTIVHELCHELMHQNYMNTPKKEIRELQAETAAYVVSRYYGIEGLRSPNYIALFGLTSSDIYQNTLLIQKTAKEIITSIDNWENEIST